MTKNKEKKAAQCSPITQKEYWDLTYSDKDNYHSKKIDDYRYFCDKLIYELLAKYYHGGSVLEVGAGGSDWLIEIAGKLKPSYCVGLDYSQSGCNSLSKKSGESGVDIDVIHADMFSPPGSLIGSFDFVISFGVVEHFKGLAEVLRSVKSFSKPGGIVFTLIPNMAGIYGWLTKKWNREIYDIHVPHDLESFVKGHKDAGLDIIWGDYLGSSHFGVVSSCFQKHSGMKYWIFKQLTRISKIVWFVESKTRPFPVTRIFSPYIIIVSRVPA